MHRLRRRYGHAKRVPLSGNDAREIAEYIVRFPGWMPRDLSREFHISRARAERIDAAVDAVSKSLPWQQRFDATIAAIAHA